MPRPCSTSICTPATRACTSAYESAVTRLDDGQWYNLLDHLPWIGARTASVAGAHVEYFCGISNPIGIKVAASTTPDDCLRVLDALDPLRQPGRITLIHRFGAANIREGIAGANPRCPSLRADRFSGAATRCTATRKARRAASKRATSRTS
jgi:3-deoxy-7-phosphoheptulonate synthase